MQVDLGMHACCCPVLHSLLVLLKGSDSSSRVYIGLACSTLCKLKKIMYEINDSPPRRTVESIGPRHDSYEDSAQISFSEWCRGDPVSPCCFVTCHAKPTEQSEVLVCQGCTAVVASMPSCFKILVSSCSLRKIMYRTRSFHWKLNEVNLGKAWVWLGFTVSRVMQRRPHLSLPLVPWVGASTMQTLGFAEVEWTLGMHVVIFKGSCMQF